MNVHVLYFASARDRAGGISEETLELPPGATVADLTAEVVRRRPGLAALLPRCRVAVDAEFAGPTTPLTEGVETAIIPPVSGG